jgi:hypothetical protein
MIPFDQQNAPIFPWREGPISVPTGPGGTIGANPVAIGENDTALIYNRTQAIIVYSAVKYKDIFRDIDRVSEVCVRIRYAGRKVDPATNKETPFFESYIVGGQNRTT